MAEENTIGQTVLVHSDRALTGGPRAAIDTLHLYVC